MKRRSQLSKTFVMVGMSILLLMLTLAIRPAAAQPAATPAVGGPITLDFNSLPTAQGWTSIVESSTSETDVFSVSDGLLHQNTVGKGGATYAVYVLPDVVDANRPFTLSVRARVLEHEGDEFNPWSFDLVVMTGAESFEVGISPTEIRSTTGTLFSNTIDNTQFHDYRMEGIPGVSLSFFVDDVLVGTDVPYPFVYPNQLWFGDSTQGSNARADIASYSFTQPSLVTTVAIDIKPGSVPNCFNNNDHGVIPVAILGSATFDATAIDPATVKLEGLAIKAVGKGGKLLASIKDVNNDGFQDMVVQIQDVDGVFTSGSTTATLTGNLSNGTSFQGTDSICAVP